jgi:outer membrane protein insertion porin family
MRNILRLSLICLLILFLPKIGFSQELEPPREEETLAFPRGKRQKPVTAIEVKGNKAISSNTIVSKMKTRIGNPYLENVISEDLKRLYLLGFFSDIKIDTEDYKDGLKVIVTVIERPIIGKITFSGIKRPFIKEDKLRESLKSKETQYLDYPSLAEDLNTIKNLYEKKGFNQAEVKYDVSINKETNKAKVIFNVFEGQKIRIKNILVDGNTAFSDRRILRLIKTRRAWFFNPGVLKEEVLEEDINRIKIFYARAGFSDVEAKYEVRPDEQKPYLLYVFIEIKEGKRYLVGNISIEGNRDISEDEILLKLKEAVPGEPFSQEALKQDIVEIQGIYFDRGYIMAQINDFTALNPYTGRIDITYNIIENEVVYVDKIKVRGNAKTKDLVIRRELRIYPGDKFDGKKLRRSKERLQNLGFFHEVSYDTQDTAVANKKDLIVDVKESKTGAFSFGGGYSTVDQFVGFLEIEQKNFDWNNFPYFTGAGQNLKLRLSIGTINSGYDLSFTEPWFLGTPVSFGFDGYRRERERESDIGYGYDEKITGGDLRLGKEITEYVRADFTYRYDILEISNVNIDATNDLKREEGKNKISSVELGFTFDSRDNKFDTSKGNVFSTSMQYAGGELGGTKDFWKAYTRASHYLPLFKGSVLEFRTRLGLADATEDSQFVPIYERFFAGGAYSIRGYHERKIGPIDPVTDDPLGGEAMLIGNVEYTYPIFDFLKLAAFYDTGNVWGRKEDLGEGDLFSSVGFGLRLKTPIGPIMLDYGIPLDTEPGEEEKGSGRFHFSMSHGF